MFPELLEELSHSWAVNPFSGMNTVLGAWFRSVDLKDLYFHIPIYSPHRKFLRFTFKGINTTKTAVVVVVVVEILQIQGVHTVHRGGDRSAEAAGHPPGHISGRLAAFSPFVHARAASAGAWLHNKREEEQADSHAGRGFSGLSSELRIFNSTPFRRASRELLSLSCSLLPGQDSQA